MSDSYDIPIKCQVCGNTKFYHLDDYGYDYDYCTECNAAYDEDGNLLAEGPDFDPNDD